MIKALKYSLILSLLGIANIGFGASDGNLGTNKSIGNLNIYYRLDNQVAISNLEDIDFGTNPPMGMELSIHPCIYTNTPGGMYRITISSDNARTKYGTDFQLESNGHYVPYEVVFYPYEYSSEMYYMRSGEISPYLYSYNVDEACASAGDTLSRITFRLNSAITYPGDYTDYVTIQIDAQ